jgi:hypothetical protein
MMMIMKEENFIMEIKSRKGDNMDKEEDENMMVD